MSVEEAGRARMPSPFARRRDALRKLPVLRAAQETLNGIANATYGTTSTLTWETAADWDNAVSESGVAHEAVTNTDHGDDTILQQGYSYGAPNLSTNLVSIHPLHEDSGSTAYDVYGSRNAPINGATIGQTPGILGSSYYSFDGTDDWVDLPNDYGIFDGSQDFTISAWFRTSDTSNNAFWFSFRGEHAVRSDIKDSGEIRFQVYDPNINLSDAVTPGSWNDGSWHHFVGRFISGTSNSVWIDGTERDSSSHSFTSLDAQARDNAIGVDKDGNEGYKPVDVAEFMVWGRSLSSSDIQFLYDVGATAGTLTTATKSFSSGQTPDLQNLDYSLNGVTDIQLDVIGSPGTASEEIVTQQLDGGTSYTLTWSNSHTDFRLKPYPDNESDVTRTPTINRLELVQ